MLTMIALSLVGTLATYSAVKIGSGKLAFASGAVSVLALAMGI